MRKLTVLDESKNVKPINRNNMYKWILSVLNGEMDIPFGWDYRELTAREIATVLYRNGYIPIAIRQATAPRLTELLRLGKVEVTGRKVDEQSKKTVSIYKVVTNEKN